MDELSQGGNGVLDAILERVRDRPQGDRAEVHHPAHAEEEERDAAQDDALNRLERARRREAAASYSRAEPRHRREETTRRKVLDPTGAVARPPDASAPAGASPGFCRRPSSSP